MRSVAWTADDSMLVSTGADGAVYEYYVQAETANPGRDGRRVHDFVNKTSSFSGSEGKQRVRELATRLCHRPCRSELELQYHAAWHAKSTQFGWRARKSALG